MIKLNYPNCIKNTLSEYKSKLHSTEFNTKNGRKNLEKYFIYEKENNTEFENVFKNYSLDDLIFCFPNNFEKTIADIEKNILKLNTNNFKDGLKKIFNYVKFQKNVITPFFTENFNFSTCYYCNREYISNFFKEKKEISTFQLDHFYDKAKYPYLSLSFFNFIPSCATCNSKKVKGEIDSKKEELIILNSKRYDFDKKVKFKTFIKNTNSKLQFNSTNDIDLFLKEDFTKKYQNFINKFYLNERYEIHKIDVIKMINKRQKYPESRIKEIAELTLKTSQEIKEDLFGKFIFKEKPDISKRPLSKLKIDLAKELKIL